MKFKPNRGIVELCLTYRCNVKCDNCSNLCTQAPFKGDLTPMDVFYFLDDICKNEIKIGQITLHGGEPVLNPHIEDIVKILIAYRKVTDCALWLLTNNSCDLVREKTTRLSVKYDIALGISTKHEKNIDRSGSPIEYVQVNNSPIDRGVEYDDNCFQTATCGICFNYLGFFPCSPMAAAARIFNYVGERTIAKLTDEKCSKYFQKHCGHCGFSTPEAPRAKEQVTSKTWVNMLEKYNTQNRGVHHDNVGA